MFSLVYRNGQAVPVTGPVSFLIDFCTVLVSEAVTRWGMFIAIIQSYFLVRLVVVCVHRLVHGEWDWKKMII